ncbi:MAG TPA: GGDEF domain-containing protein [Rudaea sp.]|nr:GGDEF domain-containing protein [Rudaea sp.]
MQRPLGVRALSKDQNFKTERATVLDPATTQETRSSPRLIVVSGVLLGRQIELGESPVTIGRSSECTIALPHPSVSRHHCRIWRENGRYRIEDLGSTNRTFLNGEVVTRADLRDGDQISVGSNALKFFVGTSVEARYHDELIDLAIYDSLTGFYNRRHFRSLLDDELKKVGDEGALSLLMFDLDCFKAINDQHGHLVGDQVLGGVADILRARAPAGAFIGRLGGEEFAMVLRDTRLSAAIAVGELLRAAVAARPLILRDKQLRVTISVGVAEWAGRGGASSDILHAADEQLYRSKQAGRDRVSPAQ